MLIDFGSARQAVVGKSRSVTAIVTSGYAPIEQYSAKGHQGPWTDIYGMGAVCYRCLTGAQPDDATERLREDRLVPAVKQCKNKASASLLGAIDRALRVDEGERPQMIAEWRQALTDKAEAPAYRWRKDTAKSTTRPSSPSSQGSRDGLLSKLLLAGMVLALVGGAAYWWRQNESLAPPVSSNIFHQSTIDRLWEISGRDNPEDKERLEQAVLEMSPDERDAWYAKAHEIIEQHDLEAQPDELLDDPEEEAVQKPREVDLQEMGPSVHTPVPHEEAELPAKALALVQWSQLTLDIQNILTAMGYNPGIADGIYGERTKVAIEAFQRDIDIPVDGQMSPQLLRTMINESLSIL